MNAYFQTDSLCFQNSNLYEGELRNGLLHGKGKFTWSEDGVCYTGDFSNNEISGTGRIEWPDGSYYEGEVVRGMRHGQGTYFHPSGLRYVGQWNNGKKHGKGRLEYNSSGSSFYEGEWFQGMRNGYGVYRYPKGATYEGFWQAGKRSGDGTLHWTDRDEIYTGTWVDGKQHGLGCHAWHILRVRTTQYSLPNVYDGQWKNGKRSGLGTFHYPNGSKYVGYWENNLKHGKGTLILKDGRICERQFVEDRLVSCTDDSQANETNQLGLERLDTRMPLWTEKQFKSAQLELQLCDTSDSNLLEHYLRPHIPEPYYNDMELRSLQNFVTANLPSLRCIYQFYGKLGMERLPDNTIIMRYIQFCQLLKDCRLHEHTSLAALDRIIAISYGTDDVDQIQNPERLVSFGTFVNILVILACNLYAREQTVCTRKVEPCKPSEALVCLMTQAILPHACKTVSPFYSDENKALVIMRFMESVYQFFRFLVHLRSKPEVTPSTITMRDFIFMLRDLNLLDEDLPVGFVIEILCESNPSAGPFKECDLETELTFFDFFEALVQCATIPLMKNKSPPPPAIVETKPSREEVRNTETEFLEQPELRDDSDTTEHLKMLRAKSPRLSGSIKKTKEKKYQAKEESKPELELITVEVNKTADEVTMDAGAVGTDNEEIGPSPDKPVTDGFVEEHADEFERWNMVVHNFFQKRFGPAAQQFELLTRMVAEQKLLTS
ncbi:hypothetical protein P879_01891 [Paragonimus westermani]|uniref:Radial spoke head 10 n=1 Tax=Paragonimus westermani TaxID=34504 RepID=A0A8T0DGU7_9TREM|nr:hypothetical protein P879_01891 [Paragonimus westermani]